MSESNDQVVESSTEPVDPPKFVTTILAVLEIIPLTEMRLRSSLVMLADGVHPRDIGDPFYWKRSLQLFGNRVHEFKESKVSEDQWPSWVAAVRTLLESAARKALSAKTSAKTETTT